MSNVYNGGGASSSFNINKVNQGNKGSGKPSRPYSRIVNYESTSPDDAKSNKGFILCTDEYTGDKLKVYINEEDFVRNERSMEEKSHDEEYVKKTSNAPYVGHLIDSKMKAYFEEKKRKSPKSPIRFVIEDAIYRTKKDDRVILAAKRVVNYKSTKKDKLHLSLASCFSRYEPELSKYQVKQIILWDNDKSPEHTTVAGINFNDEAKMNEFYARTDEIYNNRTETFNILQSLRKPNEKKYLPKDDLLDEEMEKFYDNMNIFNKFKNIVFRFRVCIKNPFFGKTDESHGKYPYLKISQTNVFFNEVIVDEEDSKKKTYHPISSRFIKEQIEGFTKFIKENSELVGPYHDTEIKEEDLILQVVYGYSSQASSKTKYFMFNEKQTGSPFYMMSRSYFPLSIRNSEQVFSGSNFGGSFLIVESPDERIEEKNEEDEVIATKINYKQYINVMLQASSYLGDIDTYITIEPETKDTKNQFKCSIAPEMKRIDIKQFTGSVVENSNHDDSGEFELQQEEHEETLPSSTIQIDSKKVKPAEIVDDLDDDIPF